MSEGLDAYNTALEWAKPRYKFADQEGKKYLQNVVTERDHAKNYVYTSFMNSFTSTQSRLVEFVSQTALVNDLPSEYHDRNSVIRALEA